MEDAVSINPDHVNSSSISSVSVYTSGSHCWEPDGSFHPVCFFVCGMSIVCGIVQMVLATIREPENIHETLKMYKLQPIQGSSTAMSRNCTAENLNTIETLETVTIETAETGTGRQEDCKIQLYVVGNK